MPWKGPLAASLTVLGRTWIKQSDCPRNRIHLIIPYEEVRDFIRKFLQEKESKVKLAAHVAKLREKATIEIMPDEPL